MDTALVFVTDRVFECFEYFKAKGLKDLIVLLIGHSKIFRELGTVYVIIDKKYGLEVAEKFFDETAKIDKLFICGPTEFADQAQKKFSKFTNEIFTNCHK